VEGLVRIVFAEQSSSKQFGTFDKNNSATKQAVSTQLQKEVLHFDYLLRIESGLKSKVPGDCDARLDSISDEEL
jgi:hypothetical protein